MQVVSIGSIGDKQEILRGKCLFLLGLLQSPRSFISSKKAIKNALQYLLVNMELPLLQACTLHLAQTKNLLDSRTAISHLDACVAKLSKEEVVIFQLFLKGVPLTFQLILDHNLKELEVV